MTQQIKMCHNTGILLYHRNCVAKYFEKNDTPDSNNNNNSNSNNNNKIIIIIK